MDDIRKMETSENGVHAKVKVLQITQCVGGGVQKYVIQLCRHLNRRLFTVTGCCSTEDREGNGDTPFSEAFRAVGVPFVVVPMQRAIHPWKDFISFLRIYGHLKQRKFDIVHAHSSKAGVLARIAARMAGVSVIIYSPHAFSFAGSRNIVIKLLYIVLERIAALWGDSIITDSVSERNLALKWKIDNEKNAVVIPPGIDVEEYNFDVSPEERAGILKKLDIPVGHKLITMVARLAPQKDPFTFIHAAHKLTGKCPDASFLLVGDGPLREGCRALVGNLKLDDRVKVVGWRRDYNILLALSDMVVIPSLWEGLPFILLEAMALGKPVVAAGSSGLVDVIAAGETGFLFSPRSPDSLAERMRWILDNPESAISVGKAARRTVEENYRLETCVSLTEALYLHLLKSKGKGAGVCPGSIFGA
ncbi:MAG: glycosyltransferase family 4 protein [Deltaproteobacteria bacterium]|nr:glycosyltransferase family 4 protein [Deltaproteobacteria bacterium]